MARKVIMASELKRLNASIAISNAYKAKMKIENDTLVQLIMAVFILGTMWGQINPIDAKEIAKGKERFAEMLEPLGLKIDDVA